MLDWLAAEFMESGWDLKHILRLIALSATYRQSSRTSPDMLAAIRGDQLLNRAPARRLTAEMFSRPGPGGLWLLAEKLGRPEREAVSARWIVGMAIGDHNYGQGHGADLYRRSL